MNSQGDQKNIKEIIAIKPTSPRESFTKLFSKTSEEVYIPKEIISLIVKIGKKYKPKNVLDPACGLCQILSSIKYCDDLSGIEINKNAYDISKELFKNIKISLGNFLYLDNIDKYDQIILVPPFGNKITLKNKREAIEYFFIDKSLDLLNDNGVLIALVPNTFLFSQRFEVIRKRILSKFTLEAIIDFKPGLFKHTGISTSVIVVKKSTPSNKGRVYFAKYEGNPDEISNNLSHQKGDFWIDGSTINNRIDRSFFDPKYSVIEKQLYGIEVKEIRELADVMRGKYVKKDKLHNKGEYLILSGKNIKEGKLILTPRDKFIDQIPKNFEKVVLRPGDVVISLIFNQNKIYIYNEGDIRAVASNNCAIIRSKDYGKYISTYLRSLEGSKVFSLQLDRKRHGSVISSISLYDLRQIKIPIAPIDNPNSIFDDGLPKQERFELVSGLIEDQLIKKGWEIRKETSIGDIRLDIGLYVNETLYSFVEIKPLKARLNDIKGQIELYLRKASLDTAFVIQNNTIFQYIDRQLIALDAFPTVDEFIHSKTISEIKQRVESKASNVSSNLESVYAQILSSLKELDRRTQRIESTVNEIKDIVVALHADFEQIKQEDREDEEKLILLYSKMDKMILGMNLQLKDEIDSYKELAKNIILNWDKLEPLSKEYYPLAEYLFSKLQEFPEIDFSPVILQYCRTIENELLKKLFIKFTKYILDKYKEIDAFLEYDLKKGISGKTNLTFFFADTIKKSKAKNEDSIRYSFGQMYFILDLVSSEKLLNRSPLMKEFRKYIEKNFNHDDLLSVNYLKEIKSVINDFRNKCAHPSKLNLDEAKECKARIPVDIDTFIDSNNVNS